MFHCVLCVHKDLAANTNDLAMATSAEVLNKMASNQPQLTSLKENYILHMEP